MIRVRSFAALLALGFVVATTTPALASPLDGHASVSAPNWLDDLLDAIFDRRDGRGRGGHGSRSVPELGGEGAAAAAVVVLAGAALLIERKRRRSAAAS